MASIEADVAGIEAGATIRLPANMLGMLREAYGSREKTLDWIIAGIVTVTMIWVFWGTWKAGAVGGDVNAGRVDNFVPNMDVDGAFPKDNGVVVPTNLLTYNMPVSRRQAYQRGPSMVNLPRNPSYPAAFPSVENPNEDA